MRVNLRDIQEEVQAGCIVITTVKPVLVKIEARAHLASDRVPSPHPGRAGEHRSHFGACRPESPRAVRRTEYR